MFRETEGTKIWNMSDRDMCTKYSTQIQSPGANCKDLDQGCSMCSLWTNLSELPGLLAKNVDS